MKKFVIACLIIAGLASCRSFNEIGHLDLVSTKGMQGNPYNYEVIARPNYKNKEIRKKAKKSLDLAIDQELAKYPGATHLVNVRVYAVEGWFRYKYSVIGDVVKVK